MALENIHHETQEYKDGATVDTSPYRWRCVHCDISTVSQSLLADHWLRAHQRHVLAEYVRARGHCPVCGQRITNQLRIVAHVQSDRGDFRCEKCHMVFANSGAVIKHKCFSRELFGSEDSCSNPRFAKSQTSIIRSDRQHFDVRHIDKTQVHSHGRNSRSTWLPNSIKPCKPQSSCIREDPQCSSRSISTGIIDSNDSHDYYLRSIDSHSVIRGSNASCNNNVLSIDSHSIINRSNGSDNGLNDPTQVRIKSDDSPNAELQADSVTLDESHDNDSRSVNSNCIADTRCDSFSYAAGNFVPNTDSAIAKRVVASIDNSPASYKKYVTDISHETVTDVSHQSITGINHEPLAGIARESVCDLSHRRHLEHSELQVVSEISDDANDVNKINSVNKNNSNTINDNIYSDLETISDSEDDCKLNKSQKDMPKGDSNDNREVPFIRFANVPFMNGSQTTPPHESSQSTCDDVVNSIVSGQCGESSVDVLQSAVQSVLNDCQSTGDKERPVGSCDLLASSCMDCGIISADVGEDGEVEVCGSQHTGRLVSRASTCINPPSVSVSSDTGCVGCSSSAVDSSTISYQSNSIAAVSPRNSSYGSFTSSSYSRERDAGLSSNVKTTSAELSVDSIVQTSNMLTVLTKADSVYHISNPMMLNAFAGPRYILVSSVVPDSVSSTNTGVVLNSSAANSVPVMDWNLSNIASLSSRKTHATTSGGSDIICSKDDCDDSIQSTIKPSSIPDNVQLASCVPSPTEAPSTEAFIVTSNCTRVETPEISPNSSAADVACSLSDSASSKFKDIVISTPQALASDVKACSSSLISPLTQSLSIPSITLSSTLSANQSTLIPITSTNIRSSPSSPTGSNSSSVQISTTSSSFSNPDMTTLPSAPANPKHRSIEKFVCDVCGHLFANSSSLRNHQLLHVQPGFACRLCGRKFARKDFLLNHLSSHSTAQVRCPLCPRRLKTRKSLAIHMKLHSGQSRFPCPHCSRSFIQKNSLQRHLAGVHSNQTGGDGPHVCPVCRRHFAAQYRLKRHMVLHNRERVFVCVVCSRSFCSGEDLRRHTRAVHSAAQYVCPYCRVRIRVKSNMIRHLSRTHQNCRSEWQCVGFVDNLLQIASDSSTTAALLAPHTVLMTLTSGGHSGNLDSDQQQSDTNAEQESDVVLYVLSAPSDS